MNLSNLTIFNRIRPDTAMAAKKRMAMRSRKLVLSIFLWILALAFIFPVVMTLTNSFMDESEIAANYSQIRALSSSTAAMAPGFATIKLIPDIVTLSQYYEVLIGSTSFLMMFWNSVRLTLPIIIGQMVVGSMAAYAFAMLKFRGRNALFFVYIITMLMPFQVTLVPNYLMADRLGLIGKYESIVLPGIFATFGVFLLRQFMSYIPKENMEAAKIDGAGHPTIFLKIIMPLCMPALASLAILSLIDNWNMVEQPLIFLKDANLQPLSLFLSKLNSGAFGVAFAASALFMMPILIVFLYGENYLVEGIQMSSLKD
jgi:multiple sugar transport system permease protein